MILLKKNNIKFLYIIVLIALFYCNSSKRSLNVKALNEKDIWFRNSDSIIVINKISEKVNSV